MKSGVFISTPVDVLDLRLLLPHIIQAWLDEHP